MKVYLIVLVFGVITGGYYLAKNKEDSIVSVKKHNKSGTIIKIHENKAIKNIKHEVLTPLKSNTFVKKKTKNSTDRSHEKSVPLAPSIALPSFNTKIPSSLTSQNNKNMDSPANNPDELGNESNNNEIEELSIGEFMPTETEEYSAEVQRAEITNSNDNENSRNVSIDSIRSDLEKFSEGIDNKALIPSEIGEFIPLKEEGTSEEFSLETSSYEEPNEIGKYMPVESDKTLN